MKLVELLAKNLDSWADTTEFYVQDPSGTIYPCVSTPYWNGAWCGAGGFIDQNGEAISKDLYLSSDHDTAIVTRKMWQAERDRQKGGEWKRHRGGKQPVADEVVVEYKLRDGYADTRSARRLSWTHEGCESDVMKYRVISQPQAEEVEVKDTTIGTLSYKVEIDTTEATQAIDELASKWDQIETPFKWRDEVTELNAYIEKYTRERDALIERLASEGFALIPPVVSVVSEFSGADMSDWRNWKAGDIVTSVTNYGNQFSIGSEYEIENIENETLEMVADDVGDPNGWCVDNFKFIRRP